MGSRSYDQEAAARRLGVTVRSLRNYVTRGLLRREVENGKPIYPAEDVDQLALDMGRDHPPMNRANFCRLMSRLERLERDMSVVRKMLDLRTEPLRPPPSDCQGLLTAARMLLMSSAPWKADEMLGWADIFGSMDEEALKMVAEASGDPSSWETFFRLNLAMLRQVTSTEGFKANLELQTLFMRLDAGRKQLRGAVLMLLELGGTPLPGVKLASLEAGSEGLLRRLGKNPGS
jgi:hypothetical protein